LTGRPSDPPRRAAQIEALLQRHWWQAQPTGLMRCLAPLSWLYGVLVRRARRRSAPQSGPGVPVLVVGNLVVGGAGKTPAVIALVQAFQAAGRKPGVISRGHGREGSGDGPRAVKAGDPAQAVGDEPLLIQRRTGVPVWVASDRSAAAKALCAAQPEVDVLLSDDGLQHHRLRRDAELLVFDDRGVGNGLLLPAGPLREPLPAQAGRQQRVLYTGQCVSTALPGALGRRRLGLAWPLGDWLRRDPSTALDLHQLAGRRLLAVAGLAAPQKFFDMLHSAGLVFDALPLPDHHPYATLPWPAGTPEVLTTEKDAVKLVPDALQGTRVWVLPLDFQLPKGLAADLLTLLPAPQPKSLMP
jgi:tetraacyldisaccharide 4'-kinase